MANVYLAGAIERAPNGYAEKWRDDITPILAQLGLNVINPIIADENKPEWVNNLPEWKVTNLDKYRDITKRFIIQRDYDFVRSCVGGGFVIALWDEYCAKGAGTACEISEAGELSVPTLIVSKVPIVEIPGWLLGASYPAPVFDRSETKEVSVDDFSGAIDYIKNNIRRY